MHAPQAAAASMSQIETGLEQMLTSCLLSLRFWKPQPPWEPRPHRDQRTMGIIGQGVQQGTVHASRAAETHCDAPLCWQSACGLQPRHAFPCACCLRPTIELISGSHTSPEFMRQCSSFQQDAGLQQSGSEGVERPHDCEQPNCATITLVRHRPHIKRGDRDRSCCWQKMLTFMHMQRWPSNLLAWLAL